MPVGDLQQKVIRLISIVLKADAQATKSFPWLRNIHLSEDCGRHFPTIDRIFTELKGDHKNAQVKRNMPIPFDAYFGGDYNFIIEFDEIQHFSTPRMRTLELYPRNIGLGFNLNQYRRWCGTYRSEADQYRRTITPRDFNFDGGRTAQRAFFDAMKDLVPQMNGLRPTVRISSFELPSPLEDSGFCLEKLRALLDEKRRFAEKMI
jgi:hypothetical protein